MICFARIRQNRYNNKNFLWSSKINFEKNVAKRALCNNKIFSFCQVHIDYITRFYQAKHFIIIQNKPDLRRPICFLLKLKQTWLQRTSFRQKRRCVERFVEYQNTLIKTNDIRFYILSKNICIFLFLFNLCALVQFKNIEKLSEFKHNSRICCLRINDKICRNSQNRNSKERYFYQKKKSKVHRTKTFLLY